MVKKDKPIAVQKKKQKKETAIAIAYRSAMLDKKRNHKT